MTYTARYPSPYHRDEFCNLSAINPVGPATAPTVDPNGEGWLFAGVATDNVAILSVQVNHDNVQGSVAFGPHLHWRKTTAAAGNVDWRLEYKVASPGGDFGSYVQIGTDVNTPIVATVDNNTAERHLITAFSSVNITIAPSTIIYFKLTRVASDAVNDTYNADALAMFFDPHRLVDSPGSSTEYTK